MSKPTRWVKTPCLIASAPSSDEHSEIQRGKGEQGRGEKALEGGKQGKVAFVHGQIEDSGYMQIATRSADTSSSKELVDPNSEPERLLRAVRRERAKRLNEKSTMGEQQDCFNALKLRDQVIPSAHDFRSSIARPTGYIVFTGKGDVKTIDNSPNPTLGVYDSLVSFKGGVPLLVWDSNVPCCGNASAFPIRGGEKERASSKEVRSLAKEDNLVEPSLCFESLSKLPSLKGTPPVTDLREEREASSPRKQVAHPKSREVELFSERGATLSKVARLWKELEVSRAEVMCHQA
ncbi:hypothetical protein ACLOJK_016239 [Asimina triloba]